MASQFLNRCDWGSSHRQVRTEGVAKDVDTLLCQTEANATRTSITHLQRYELLVSLRWWWCNARVGIDFWIPIQK